MAHLQHSSVIPVERTVLFQYLADYKKRSRLMPPDIELELISVPLTANKGAEFDFKITRFGLSYAFTTTIDACEPGSLLVERAQFSFFESWQNTIKLEEHAAGSTLLTNLIDYSMPLGVLGTLADDLFVRKDLLRILDFSHRKLKSILA